MTPHPIDITAALRCWQLHEGTELAALIDDALDLLPPCVPWLVLPMTWLYWEAQA